MEDLTTLLREAFDSVVAELDDEPVEPEPRGSRWRPAGVLVGAAASVIALIVGLIAVSSPDDSRPVTTMVPGDEPATPWMLPTALPDGYELAGVSSARDIAPEAVTSERWVRHEDGLVTAVIDVRSGLFIDEPVPDVDDPSGRRVRVRDQSAVMVSDASRGSSRRWVRWFEAGRWRTVQTDGVDATSTLTWADALVLETDDRLGIDRLASPIGFELVHEQRTAAGEADPAVFLSVAPTTFDGTGEMHVAIRLADGPIDVHVAPEDERRQIGGSDYSIAVDDGGESPYVEVSTVRDGALVSVMGAVPIDTALSVASSLEPVPVDEARGAQEQAVERARARALVDEATLDDGRRVSVHSSRTDGAPDTLCLDGATPACGRLYTDELDDSSELERTFIVDDGWYVIGWYPDDFGPFPIEAIDPDTPAHVEAADGDAGWFVGAAVAERAQGVEVLRPNERGKLVPVSIRPPERFWP